jgi:hypothetical protein
MPDSRIGIGRQEAVSLDRHSRVVRLGRRHRAITVLLRVGSNRLLPELIPKRATQLNVALALGWTALALAVLPRHGHFLFDEALFWQRALDVIRDHRLAGYGPFISGTDPMVYTPGGAAFDLLAVAFLWTQHPLAGSIWVVVLSGIGLVLFDRALARLDLAPGVRVAAIVLYAFGIWHARTSDRIWNINLFPFASPLLLYVAARVVTSTGRARLGAAALLGIAAGLCLQIHASGLLAIGLTALLILPVLRKTPTWRIWPLGLVALGGFAVMYVPYLFEDAAHGFVNTLHLGSGRSASHLFGVAIGRSFATFAQFSSQSDGLRPEQFKPWVGIGREDLGTLTFYVAFLLFVLGALRQSRVRLMALAGFLLIPAFFAATGRDYMPHYVAAGGPFYVLPAAVALDTLWTTRLRSLAVGYLVGFLALGIANLFASYSSEVPEWQLADQLAIAAELADRSPSIRLVPESQIQRQALLYEWLAQDVLHRNLSVSEQGTPCGIFESEADAKRSGDTPRFRGRHWVTCTASSP